MEFDLSRRFLATGLLLLLSSAVFAELQVVIIEGLGGETRYAEEFAEQIAAVTTASNAMTSPERVTVFRNGDFSRETVVNYFAALNNDLSTGDSLVVFMLGHGSYDDYQYKFNVDGPDLTGDDLQTIFDSTPAGMQLLINTGSSSGAIRELLESDDRTLILATRSGVERHATRFGNYFATALTDVSADIDKNNIVTAGEAFAYAERQVADYYERNGQLATEHPRLEGGNAHRFGLARLGTRTVVREDAVLRDLLSERDALNTSIDELRLRRDGMTQDAYQGELLQNMLELATLEDRIESREAELQE